MAASVFRRRWPLLQWLALALLFLLSSSPMAAQAQSAEDTVTVVSDSDALLEAYRAKAKLIKLTGHVALNISEKTDPNAAEFFTYFTSQDDGSYAIWGECDTPLDPAIFDKYSVPPEYRSPTACGMAIGAYDVAFAKMSGRLFVSNIVIYSLMDGKLGQNRMNVALTADAGATAWMAQTVVAGPLGVEFGINVPVRTRDSSLYFINSAITDNGIREDADIPLNAFHYGSAIWFTNLDPKAAGQTQPFLGISGSYFQSRLINQYTSSIYVETRDKYAALPITVVYANNTVSGKSKRDVVDGIPLPTCGTGTVICAKFAHYGPTSPDSGGIFELEKKSKPATGVTVYSDLPPSGVTSDSDVLQEAPMSQLPTDLATVPPDDVAWLQSLKAVGVPGVDEALNPFGLLEASPLPPAPPLNGEPASPPLAGTKSPLATDEVQPKESSGGSSSRNAAIIGGVLGGVVLLALLACCAWFAVKRRRSTSPAFKSSMPQSSPAVGFNSERSEDPSKSEDHAVSWTGNFTTRTAPPSSITDFPPLTDISFTPQKLHATRSGMIDVSSEVLASNTTITSESTGQLSRVQDAKTTAEALQFVRSQISSIIKAGGGVVFGSYKLDAVEDMRAGGQGIVYFARQEGQGSQKFALKFFASERAFLNEQDMYERAALRSILPPVKQIISNDVSSWRDPRGKCVI